MDKIKDMTDIRTKAKDALAEVLAKSETPMAISEAMIDNMVAIAEKATAQVQSEYEELKDVKDEAILRARGIHTLTAGETKVMAEVVKTGGFDNIEIWPETIFENVFEGLEKDRPLLNLIDFTPTIGRVKVIKGRRKGVAVFGPLHKDLEGQLDAEFGVTEYTQLALTAFFLISNDTLDLGPRWIYRYIQICLKEAVADIWEEKIINGTGNNEPIGLLKDLDGAVVGGAYPDKAAVGALTLADDKILTEISGVMAKLSKYNRKISPTDPGTTEYRNVVGKVYMIVNPDDYFGILNRIGSRNLNGDWTYKMPHLTTEKIIPSEKLAAGRVIFMVEKGYDATQSRPSKIYTYKETFAMKRATLCAIDMLGNGRPYDNSVAAVYTIAPQA